MQACRAPPDQPCSCHGAYCAVHTPSVTEVSEENEHEHCHA